MRRAIILAFFLIAAAASSLSQDRALITGDAEDNQDTPVSGVRITLHNDELRTDRTTTTNSDGLYFFAEVTPAEGYVITADAPGMNFAPKSVKFNVEVGETRHLLPSFIAEKQTVPISRQRGPRPLDSAHQPIVLGLLMPTPSCLCAVPPELSAVQPIYSTTTMARLASTRPPLARPPPHRRRQLHRHLRRSRDRRLPEEPAKPIKKLSRLHAYHSTPFRRR